MTETIAGYVWHYSFLEFRWTVSRGRNSHGYSICSLWVDGRKVASCKVRGSGRYDMQGTVLGHWFAGRFPNHLKQLTIPTTRRNGKNIQQVFGLTFREPNSDERRAKIKKYAIPALKKRQYIEKLAKAGVIIDLGKRRALYKAKSTIPTETHIIPVIDGAYGMSSVEEIIRACDMSLEFVYESKNRSVYRLIGGGEGWSFPG